MTFEKYELAKEKYEEYENMLQLATFFNKDEFVQQEAMRIQKIQVFKDDKRQDVENQYITILIPDEIRQKINSLLWDEVHKVEDEFKSI